MESHVPIGVKDGKIVYASKQALAQHGERAIKDRFGLLPYFPVKINLSGHEVMVQADSHEEAVQRYLNTQAKKI